MLNWQNLSFLGKADCKCVIIFVLELKRVIDYLQNDQ